MEKYFIERLLTNYAILDEERKNTYHIQEIYGNDVATYPQKYIYLLYIRYNIEKTMRDIERKLKPFGYTPTYDLHPCGERIRPEYRTQYLIKEKKHW